MQYFGSIDTDGTLYTGSADDSAKVWLGKGAKLGTSIANLIEQFPGATQIVDGDDIEPRALFGDWDKDRAYKPGETARSGQKDYIAMPDVERGSAPDGVYDVDAGTGGWKPVQH